MMNNQEYIAITENALDLILVQGLLDEKGWPECDGDHGLYCAAMGEGIAGIATFYEPESPYFALIKVSALMRLCGEANDYSIDVYRRIARVLKGLNNPPIHLPRQWSEYHY